MSDIPNATTGNYELGAAWQFRSLLRDPAGHADQYETESIAASAYFWPQEPEVRDSLRGAESDLPTF